MASAVTIAAQIAKRGDLTPARMPAVFLTLERNAEWWAVKGPPAAGSPGENGARGRRCKPLPARARAARVAFPGSELVFQYYPGLGLQLQMNGTWGKANALFGSATRCFVARGAALLNELLALGRRALGRARVGVHVPDLRRPPAVDQRAVAGDGGRGAHARGGEARAARPAEHRGRPRPARSRSRRRRAFGSARPGDGVVRALQLRPAPARAQRAPRRGRRAVRRRAGVGRPAREGRLRRGAARGPPAHPRVRHRRVVEVRATPARSPTSTTTCSTPPSRARSASAPATGRSAAPRARSRASSSGAARGWARGRARAAMEASDVL